MSIIGLFLVAFKAVIPAWRAFFLRSAAEITLSSSASSPFLSRSSRFVSLGPKRQTWGDLGLYFGSLGALESCSP